MHTVLGYAYLYPSEPLSFLYKPKILSLIVTYGPSVNLGIYEYHHNICASAFLSLCVVHGFASASYNVIEDANLATTFSFNVKGESSFLGVVTGRITSRAGGTSRKLVCGMFLEINFCLYSLVNCRVEWKKQ